MKKGLHIMLKTETMQTQKDCNTVIYASRPLQNRLQNPKACKRSAKL
jgi:hypothetical protein